MKTILCVAALFCSAAFAGQRAAEVAVTFPPQLPDGQTIVLVSSPEFLVAPETIRKDVAVAKTAPKVEFMYFPGQNYPGKPWSAWGDSLAVNGKYYASIGDHLAPAGNAFVFEYDPKAQSLVPVVDLKALLKLPAGDYSPGKIHSRIDMGSDGCLYFSTHRGSTSVTTDAYNYKGDWIVKYDPQSKTSEAVVCGPVPKHCIPCSVLDPKRMIFYGGTAAGVATKDDEGIQFFAYDLKQRKVLYAGPNGPPRYMIFAKSTGRIYYTPGKNDEGKLVRYDPDKGGKPEPIETVLGLRTATQETPQHIVYTVSQGQGGRNPEIWAFDTQTEKVEKLITAAIGKETYITSVDADPSGRFLYYIPGAHGGSEHDGSPLVQFDTKTRTHKVIAFFHSFFEKNYKLMLKGTFSSAVDETGATVYITWNVSRGSKAWDSAALMAIHIPESER